MPLVQTRGAASAQGFGEFARAAVAANFIEDVFSTYLYTGTGSTQTITNNINITGKGALVWLKNRGTDAVDPYGNNHLLQDTARGYADTLTTNTENPQDVGSSVLNSFTSSGFTTGYYASKSSNNYVSWTFRKQPKFFDVVTWTGNGANRTIAHALDSIPGCIIVKRTDTTAAWAVYHRSLANTEYLVLNTTAAKATGATRWNSTTPTSTVFSIGTDATVNSSGGTYVAYVFAHDAGGFGLTGTDNVISCGSYVGTGAAGNVITLGYEPQWLLVKMSSSGGYYWQIVDNMRGIPTGGNDAVLYPNTSDAETSNSQFDLTSTGFTPTNVGNSNVVSETYIYIAIRRGPMKVPTLGTSVFSPVTYTGTGAAQNIVGPSLPTDLFIGTKNQAASNRNFFDRLRGAGQYIWSDTTGAEQTDTNTLSSFAVMNGVSLGTATMLNQSTVPYIGYFMRRAPSFFDEVCYTGTGSARTQAHNLGVAPELAIVKDRNVGSLWYVQNAAMFAAYTGVSPGGYYCVLDTTAALIDGAGNYVYNPTASTISLDNGVNFNTRTYVAYLFATCPGVSKVGSYTGNGTTQTINCGFTGGARFVLIKRTDASSGWYVYDTARGMTALTDPYLFLNSTAAEVATLGSVITVATGFALNSAILADINVSAGTYIFLAIA